MKFSILGILLILNFSVFAQQEKPKGKNDYMLSFTGSNYFSKINVVENPDNTLFGRNTFGYALSLEYNRVTKNNIILSAALDYGHHLHSIDVIQNLENFDPEAKEALAGYVYEKSYGIDLPYVGPKLMVGYQYPIAKGWDIQGKIGVRRIVFLKGDVEWGEFNKIEYRTDNGAEVRSSVVSKTWYMFGEIDDAPKVSKIFPFNTWLDTWEFNIAAKRKVSSWWIKSVDFGINIKHGVGPFITPIFTNMYITKYGEENYKKSEYIEKSFAAGLVVGITL